MKHTHTRAQRPRQAFALLAGGQQVAMRISGASDPAENKVYYLHSDHPSLRQAQYKRQAQARPGFDRHHGQRRRHGRGGRTARPFSREEKGTTPTARRATAPARRRPATALQDSGKMLPGCTFTTHAITTRGGLPSAPCSQASFPLSPPTAAPPLP
jgi:hypothetical protein